MSEQVWHDVWCSFWDDVKASILHYINIVDDGSYYNLFPPVMDCLTDDLRGYTDDKISELLLAVDDAPNHIREQIDERYLSNAKERYADLDDDRVLVMAAMVFIMDMI